MKPLRWLAAGLVWILAGLLGLVGGLLCLTVLLLPLGIPILMLARRMFSLAARLVMPRALRHPAQESGKAVKGRGKAARRAAEQGKQRVARSGGKAMKKTRKSMPEPVADALPGRRRGLLGKLGVSG